MATVVLPMCSGNDDLAVGVVTGLGLGIQVLRGPVVVREHWCTANIAP